MLESINEHVDNNFNPMPQEYVEEFIPICNDVELLLENVSRMIRSGNFSNADEYLVEGNDIKSRISQIRHKQQEQIQKLDSNIRTTLLYLSTLQETQELVSMARHLLRASKRFQVS